jgi:acetyl esterase/lipase
MRTERRDACRVGRLPLLAVVARSWSPARVSRRVMRFGEDRRQVVVAFVPKDPRPGPWVYFLFGGGWTSGSVRSWSFAGNWFALHGIPAVLGGYRLAPGCRLPAQLDDALEGFAFAQRHAQELGVQGRPAVLSGARPREGISRRSRRSGWRATIQARPWGTQPLIPRGCSW